MFIHKPPNYLTEYINHRSGSYLIVCSDDCELTCNRIQESIKNCTVYDATKILETIKAPNEDLTSDAILLTNLEGNLSPIYNIEQSPTLKAVFVTHVNEAHLLDKVPEPKDWWKVVYDSIHWTDLSTTTRWNVISELNKRLKLDEQQLSNCLNNVDSKMLINCLRGNLVEPAHLFNETTPLPLSYYVKRTLQTRHVIKRKLLDTHPKNDIILLSGIEKSALSDWCRAWTITSSFLMRNKTEVSPFIVQESSADFKMICRIFPEKSVHLLNYEKGEFVWKKTKGSVSMIQEFVSLEQNSIHQSEFISEILSQSTLSPVCISDTPGKGKSILLAAIATDLKNHHTNGLVGFIRMKELIQQLVEREGKFPTASKTASVISSLLSSSPLGHAYLTTHTTYLKELMLDGFDEIDADDTDFGYDCLDLIQEAFNETRIWITSTPHMLPRLERVLGTLGYNISPFSDQDQEDFLASYWENCIAGCRKEKVSIFARECLEKIKISLIKTGEDIAGIPLQCYLIAEAYQKHATQFMKGSSSEEIFSSPLKESISGLYRKLIEKKLADFRHKYNSSNLSKKEIFVAHMRLAMKFLYPKSLSKFSHVLVSQMSMQEIIDFGLVESASILSPIRFLHTTFADYFVALLVKSCIEKKSNHLIHDFLLNHVMKTEKFQIVFEGCSRYDPDIVLPCFKFTNYVTCYFLNRFLEKTEFTFSPVFFHCRLIRHVAEACVHHNYENIFAKLLSLNYLKNRVINKEFLGKAVYWANVSLLKTILRKYILWNNDPPIDEINLQFLEKHENNQEYDFDCYSDVSNDSYNSDDSDFMISDSFLYVPKKFSLLHLAMTRSDHSTVHFLVATYFDKIADEIQAEEYNYLVYMLLKNSDSNTQCVIAEKKRIIQYIAAVNIDLLIVENSDNTFPLEAPSIHIELVKEVWRISKQFYMKRNVLIRLFRHFLDQNFESCSNFIESVFTTLNPCQINSIFSTTWSCCLLKKVLMCDGVTTEFLEFLKKNCSKFCCVDNECKIEAFWRASCRQHDLVLEWLLNNFVYTTKDLTVILQECLSSRKAANVVLNHLIGQNTTYDMSYYFEVFNLVFPEADPTNFENVLKFVHLIIFFVLKLHSKEKIMGDLETTAMYLVDLGLKYCEALLSENLINNFQSRIIKLLWISYFHKNSKQEMDNRLKRCLESGDIHEKDNFGNNLLHIFASYFELAGRFIDSFLYELDTPNKISFEINVNRIWELLVENSLNILQCNHNHLTPIELLPKHFLFDEAKSSALMFAAKHMAHQTNWNISDAHKLFYLVIKYNYLNVVEEVYKWYSNICASKNIDISQVKIIFGSETRNFLDAAIDNGCGNLVEFVNTVLQIYSPVLDPSPLCIHNSIEFTFYPTKFIEKINESFPSQIHMLVNTSNEQNLVPLSLSCIRPEHITLLHKIGADLNAKDNEGNTPLHFALKRAFWEEKVVTELIKCGANVNAQNCFQETPLSILVQKDSHPTYSNDKVECFYSLLKHGAELGLADKMGNTPLHHLFENIFWSKDLHQVMDITISMGQKHVLIVKNNEGRTPLQLADINFIVPKCTRKLLKTHDLII